MAATFPYKPGDRIPTHLGGAHRGMREVLEVHDVIDPYGQILWQHLRVDAPMHGERGLWLTRGPEKA